MVICTYPRLIAAYHVLHRLREPRHPPCALFYFLRIFQTIACLKNRSSYFQLLLFFLTYSFACINMSKTVVKGKVKSEKWKIHLLFSYLVRNQDLNLLVCQPCGFIIPLYLVRQCAKKRGRSQPNHLNDHLLFVVLWLVKQSDFSLFTFTFSLSRLARTPERRCSSRTFRYGYLVTT